MKDSKTVAEEPVEIPMDRLNPETLRNMVAEFVTREWSDTEFSLETKIEQVLKQIGTGQAKIVFDMVSKTCNIVPSKQMPNGKMHFPEP
ncbi:MAG: YheU family protein [Geobacteraceae bacterium]|nr:YheU family protein [Geobacteraceae bacterium]